MEAYQLINKIRNIKGVIASLTIRLFLFIIVIFLANLEKEPVIVCSILFLLDLILSLSLHIEYWLANKNTWYEITDKEISQIKNGVRKTYNHSEIKRLVVVLSPSLYKNSNVHLLTMEQYHYAFIQFNNGEVWIITSLLYPRLDKVLAKIKTIALYKSKKLYCNIS